MVKIYIEEVTECYRCPNYHCSNGMPRAYCDATGEEIHKKYIFGKWGFPPYCPLEDKP